MSAGYKDKLDDFASHSADECPYCARHIPSVEIGGDHFLVDTSSPKPTLVTIRNSPKWLPSIMKDFVGHNVLRVHRVMGYGSSEAKELFLDLEALCSSNIGSATFPFFRQRLERWISLSVPSTLRHIVYINDPASKALSEWIISAARSLNGNIDVQSFHHRQLRVRLESDTSLREGTLLVIGGVLATGQSMMEVNQLLRDRESDRTLYLAGITRTGSQATLDEIKQNIGYGDSGARHFPVSSIIDIFLPDPRSERVSPWDREARTWIRMDDTSQHLTAEVRQWLRKRSRLLNDVKGTGMMQDLFLPSLSNEQPLRLRKGFAFWPEIDYLTHGHSQADVYFTIAAVLYDWRSEYRNITGGGKAVCIQPSVFFRYSDGIIQSSFLRAAQGDELNYRFDATLSATMSEFISTLIDLSDEPRGEALPEFILALLEGRLVLKAAHTTGLFKKLLQSLAKPSSLLAQVLYAAVEKSLSERIAKSD